MKPGEAAPQHNSLNTKHTATSKRRALLSDSERRFWSLRVAHCMGYVGEAAWSSPQDPQPGGVQRKKSIVRKFGNLGRGVKTQLQRQHDTRAWFTVTHSLRA